MTRRRHRDAGALFGRALVKRACATGEPLDLGSVRSQDWNSATFEGERIEIDLPRVDPAARWLADLADAELHVTGYLIADVALRRADGRVTGIDALLIRDR